MLRKTRLRALAMIAVVLPAMVCGGSGDGAGSQQESSNCYVQLFDDHDAEVTVYGPGTFPDLEALPDGNRMSRGVNTFRAGESAVVTFWAEKDFVGDTFTHIGGAEKAALDKPGSMQIECADTLPMSLPGRPIFLSGNELQKVPNGKTQSIWPTTHTEKPAKSALFMACFTDPAAVADMRDTDGRHMSST